MSTRGRPGALVDLLAWGRVYDISRWKAGTVQQARVPEITGFFRYMKRGC